MRGDFSPMTSEIRLGKLRDEEKFDRPEITRALLMRILAYFKPHWRKMLLSFLAIAMSALFGLVPPFLIKNIIDVALPGRDLGLLALLTGASLAAIVIIGLVDLAENYIDTSISAHIVRDMKNAMYRHMEYMSLSFFTQVKQGDILTRMTSDISGTQDIYRSSIVNLVRNTLVLAFTAVALFLMNWKLAILGLVVVPFFALPTKKVGKARWRIAAKTQAKIQELNQIVQETLGISGSTLMKIFGHEKVEYEKYRKLNDEATRLQISESVTGRWFGMVMSVFTSLGPMLIYFYGGWLFIQGELSIGAIVTFVALLNRLYGPVIQISNVHVDLTRSLALFERIFDYFDMKHEISDKPEARDMPVLEGAVSFRDVSFAYNKQRRVLDDINLDVAPGSVIALVGSSGAGKTTFTNLIPRLYDVSDGSIAIDGMDIRDMTVESLRAHIGMVMQETYLFNASIRENLLYAKADATEAELADACRAANIHDFILTLPEGYDTLVGNRGVKLSGGEKQRISIARVILKNPKIIILDEATSSLDTISEALIQSAMEPLLKGRTSFVIAHRLSTVMAADRILVLDRGRIAESGRHEELIAQGGLYKVLYDTQFRHGNVLPAAVVA